MILRLGMTGLEVGLLHQQLVEAGYSLEAGELTRQLFGPSTKLLLEDFQNRHVGQDGHRLLADGIVGPKTQWALKHPGGPTDTYVVGGWKCEPATVRPEAADAVRAAISDLGRHEDPDSSNNGPLIAKFFRSGEAGNPWCAYASSTWLGYAKGLRQDWKRMGGVPAMREWALGHNAAVDPETAVPGDLWLTVRAGGHGHVGLIVHRFSDSQVALIEGNAGNAVRGTVRTPQSASLIVRPISLFAANQRKPSTRG